MPGAVGGAWFADRCLRAQGWPLEQAERGSGKQPREGAGVRAEGLGRALTGGLHFSDSFIEITSTHPTPFIHLKRTHEQVFTHHGHS